MPCTWEENAGENIERGKLFDIEGVVLCAVGERTPRVFAVYFLWVLYIYNCCIVYEIIGFTTWWLISSLPRWGCRSHLKALINFSGLAASLRGVQQGLQAQDLLRAVGLSGSLAGLGFSCGIYEGFRILLQRCEFSNSAGAPAAQLSSGRRRQQHAVTIDHRLCTRAGPSMFWEPGRRALCVALAFVGRAPCFADIAEIMDVESWNYGILGSSLPSIFWVSVLPITSRDHGRLDDPMFLHTEDYLLNKLQTNSISPSKMSTGVVETVRWSPFHSAGWAHLWDGSLRQDDLWSSYSFFLALCHWWNLWFRNFCWLLLLPANIFSSARTCRLGEACGTYWRSIVLAVRHFAAMWSQTQLHWPHPALLLVVSLWQLWWL